MSELCPAVDFLLWDRDTSGTTEDARPWALCEAKTWFLPAFWSEVVESWWKDFLLRGGSVSGWLCIAAFCWPRDLLLCCINTESPPPTFPWDTKLDADFLLCCNIDAQSPDPPGVCPFNVFCCILPRGRDCWVEAWVDLRFGWDESAEFDKTCPLWTLLQDDWVDFLPCTCIDMTCPFVVPCCWVPPICMACAIVFLLTLASPDPGFSGWLHCLLQPPVSQCRLWACHEFCKISFTSPLSPIRSCRRCIVVYSVTGLTKPKSNRLHIWRTKLRYRFLSNSSFPFDSRNMVQANGIWQSPTYLPKQRNTHFVT